MRVTFQGTVVESDGSRTKKKDHAEGLYLLCDDGEMLGLSLDQRDLMIVDVREAHSASRCIYERYLGQRVTVTGAYVEGDIIFSAHIAD